MLNNFNQLEIGQCVYEKKLKSVSV